MKVESRFRLILVGGPDVDSRIDLMHHLEQDFSVFAVGSEPALEARFSQAGFGYRHYHLARRVHPVADVVALAELRGIFRQERPDIVHAFDTKPCVFVRLAARLARVPVVIGTLPGLGSLYVDNGLATRAVRAIYERLQRLASYSSDLTIFQNCQDAREFVARSIVPETKVAVIPGSGVRTGRFSPVRVSQSERERVRTELGISPNALLVTMVSRLIRSKGVIEFAAAAQVVRERYPQAAFLLVGPSDQQSVDRLTPQELAQLAQNVTWAGAREDIPAVLATSDVFVLPSFYREGIPRVLLEAASMGLPIVTTDSPGCREAVEDGVNGFLVPPRDPDALARAILRLIEEPELRRRFGQASRQRAVERFDLAKIAEQTRSIYQDLLARKGLLSAGNK